MTLDLGRPLRTAILANAAIADSLDTYGGEPAIFTRRPIPDDFKGTKFILINPAAAIGDQDYLNSELPIVMRDLVVFGDQPANYRLVEQLGYDVRDLFHRKKWAITPEGYDVIRIVARGPIPGPTDDQKTVARMVGLTIELRRQP